MIPERASVSFPSSGLPLPQRMAYSSLKSLAQHSTQTFLSNMPQQCTTWPCVCASLSIWMLGLVPVACKRLVEIDPDLLAGDGGSIPEGAKSGLHHLEEPHAHGTTMSLRLTWQLFASSLKGHACKCVLCICGPCGGRELGHSQDRSRLYKEGLASRATLPSLKATRVVALAIEAE